MELEEKYERLLLEIHEAEGECLRMNEGLLREEEELHRLLNFLIEKELVEFDKKEQAYFLTYEGYEKVEEIMEIRKGSESREHSELEETQRKTGTNKFLFIALGLFLFLGGYFTLRGIQPDRSFPENINQETLEHMMKDIKAKTDSVKLRQISKYVDANPRMQIEKIDEVVFIKFDSTFSKNEMRELLDKLWDYQFDIAFHDNIHPTISDPGAYFSYSTEKSLGPEYWSMTYGNHGWSGGIYHIKKTTVYQQVYNLVYKSELDKIQITYVNFFSHYDIQATEKSIQKDQEIFAMHE